MMMIELQKSYHSLEQEKQKQLQHAYEAGIAENAISVLHNIGNAITPAVVRLRKLQTTQEKSNFLNYLDKLSKNLTEQHQAGNLDSYLRDDPKGQQMLPFFETLLTFFLMRRSSGGSFHLATHEREREASSRLVYRSYLRRGYINANASKQYFHGRTSRSEAKTFVATHKSRGGAGTITLMPDHPRKGLPLDDLFPEAAVALRKVGRRVAEIGLLAIDETLFPRHSFALGNIFKMKFLFQLYRAMFLHATTYMKLDDFLIVVHPKHIPIYRRLYFKEISDVRPYGRLKNAPAVLMHLDIQEACLLARLEHPALYDFFLD